MATTFTVRHIYPISEADFWPKVFWNDDYNTRLYKEALQFKRFEKVDEKDLGGGVKTRSLILEPKPEAPPVVMKLVGGSLSYNETGRFDPATKKWKYSIKLDKLADKVAIDGEFWVEPRGDDKVERLCKVTIDVKIFGVGGVVESFVEKKTRDDYEKAAKFTVDYIKNMK